MSDGKKYYCFCGSNCKYETMTKEQILAAIAQAVETGSVGDCDTGFITKVKELNNGNSVTFWGGTQAQYNALATKDVNCLYIITDDTKSDEIMRRYETIAENVANATDAAISAAASAADAAAAAEEANMKAGSYKGVDVSSEVLFQDANPPADDEEHTYSIEFGQSRYVYNPMTGIVHFTFEILYNGILHENAIIELDHIASNYLPDVSNAEFPILAHTRNDFCTAKYTYGAEFPAILIRVHKEVDTGGETYTANFSGWYFAAESVGE